MLKMKSIFVKILDFLCVLFVGSGIAFASVESPRYNDGEIHQGFPSWITLKKYDKDANKGESSPNVVSLNDEKYKVIALDESHWITYNGVTYKALTVYSTGKVVFGDVDKDKIDVELEPHVIPLNFENEKILGKTFKWQHFVEEFKTISGKTVRDCFTIIEFGDFNIDGLSYSLQETFYSDGEVQTQLWQNSSKTHKSPSRWMIPSFYNGYLTQIDKSESQTSGFVYGPKGVRPGWIAKGLDDNKYPDVRIKENGSGLSVNLGTNRDAGGLIAADFAREHPVVGSFSSVRVVFSRPTTANNNLSLWYFSEKETAVVETSSGHYPKVNHSDENIVLDPLDYLISWHSVDSDIPNNKSFLDLFTSDLRNAVFSNNRVQKISAPAFKFQLPGNSSWTQNMEFTIRSIEYRYEQLPSYQFLPSEKKYRVSFKFAGNGFVNMEYPTHDALSYELPEGHGVKANIVANPGSKIKKIKVNGIVILEDEKVKKYTPFEMATKSKEFYKYKIFKSFFRFTDSAPYEKLDFDVIELTRNIDVQIEFSDPDCKRSQPMVVPEKIETTKYLDDSPDGRKVISATYLNGFGGEAESQELLSTGKYIVKTSYKDAMGNVEYDPLKFVRTANDFDYVDKACYNCLVKANEFYDGSDVIDRPNAKGYAYTQKDAKYGNGMGSQGTSFGLADASAGFNAKLAESWKMPASCDDNDFDFLNQRYLNEFGIQKNYEKRIQNPGACRLTIARDNEGRFTQSITDQKGLTKATQTYDGNKEVTILYEYDNFDRLLKKYPKGFSSLATCYTYDALGRVVLMTEPDQGTTKIAYDKHGRKRFTQTAAQADKGCFTTKIYDELERVIAEGVACGSTYSFDKPDASIDVNKIAVSSRIVYGIPDETELFSLLKDDALVKKILESMTRVHDKDVGAVIAYDEVGNITSVKMSNYDRLGRKTKEWFVYGLSGVPAVQLAYEYNDSGELISRTIDEWNGSKWVEKSKREQKYGEKGRLEDVYEFVNGKKTLLSSIKYTPNGNVEKQMYYDKGSKVFSKYLTNDIHGRPVRLKYSKNGEVLYNEDISYVSAGAAKVRNVSHSYKGLDSKGDVDRNYDYEYDLLGRLESVSGSKVSKYTHDILGRMTYKKEDGITVDYEYGDELYRPVSFDVNGKKDAASKVYFEYDASGNVWMDRYNKTAYKLNDAGQPIRGYKFGSFASGITLNQVNEDNVSSSDYDASVAMSYDEGGNRLWFSFDNNDGVSYAEATMPSIGVYKRASLSGTDFELARLKLLGGGYRLLGTDGDGAAYFPITDVQGNVRAYVNKSGIVSAYDYLPYGTVLPIVQSSAADDSRWQGKEFDNEIGKFYFGARYYDPVFGMWMSPDPARQFANPYTFGGDPVNYVDPDGNELMTTIALTALAAYAIWTAIDVADAIYDGSNLLTAVGWGLAAGGITFVGGYGWAFAAKSIAGSALIAGTAGVSVNVIRNYGVNGSFGSLGSNLFEFASNALVGAFGGSVIKSFCKSVGIRSTTSQWGALASAEYGAVHDFLQANFPSEFAIVGSGGVYSIYIGDNSPINEHSNFVLVNGTLMVEGGGPTIPVYTEDEARRMLSAAVENERLKAWAEELLTQELYTPEIKTDFSDIIPNIDMTPYEYTQPDYLQNLPTINDIPKYEMPKISNPLNDDPFNIDDAAQNKMNDINNWIDGLKRI